MTTKSATFFLPSGVVFRYGFALAVMSVAFGLRLLVNPIIGTRVPYMAAFLGIAVTAQYAGFGPAVCSLILGGFLACYFFLIPVGTLAIASWGDFTGLVLYFVVGTVIVLLSEWQSNAYKLAEERQARLAGEVQKHRETADELRLQRDRLASAEEVLQRTHRILEERVEQLQTTHRHLEEHVKQLQTELTNHTQKEYQLRDERDRLAWPRGSCSKRKMICWSG
jgi:K+-sensing histidine kinase KdpD